MSGYLYNELLKTEKTYKLGDKEFFKVRPDDNSFFNGIQYRWIITGVVKYPEGNFTLREIVVNDVPHIFGTKNTITIAYRRGINAYLIKVL